jgi:hypothetical protein
MKLSAHFWLAAVLIISIMAFRFPARTPAPFPKPARTSLPSGARQLTQLEPESEVPGAVAGIPGEEDAPEEIRIPSENGPTDPFAVVTAASQYIILL